MKNNLPLRGLKIFTCLLLHDMQQAFMVHPKNIVWVIVGLLFAPLLVPIMMVSECEHQNLAIFQGLNKITICSPCATKPPRLFVWLYNMLNETEKLREAERLQRRGKGQS